MKGHKIYRVPGGDCTHEWETALSAHSDTALSAIKAFGFNAVWIRGVLRDLVQTSVFPELSPDPKALPTLRSLIAQCSRYDLKVFLYLNEPLGFPADDPFWSFHPDCRGVPGSSPDDGWDHTYALCTSSEPVKAFLREATENLFREAPGLGGAFLITASESHTHCFSHAQTRTDAGWTEAFSCPACSHRTPGEVIGEIVRLIQDGARAATPEAEIVAWNWSWTMYEPDPQAGILSELPDVPIMADFERGGKRHISYHGDGVHIDREIDVDEYSLVYAGPSPRFLGTLAAAGNRHLPCYAKLQIGTTHEIATVPNLPLIPRLQEKISALRKCGVENILGTWNFGCEPTLNTYAVGRFLAADALEDEDALLHRVASGYFPGCNERLVVQSWRQFCSAMDLHPFSMSFIYHGPVNAAPVWPWRLVPKDLPMRETWYVPSDSDAFGDKIEDCCGPFKPVEVEALLSGLTERWMHGVDSLSDGLAPAGDTAHVREELGVARMIGCQFRSAMHLFRFHRIRDAWIARPSSENASPIIDLIDSELSNLSEAQPLVAADPRLGFHAGCFPHPHQFYDTNSLGLQQKALASIRSRLQG